jgi:hypothetical protein
MIQNFSLCRAAVSGWRMSSHSVQKETKEGMVDSYLRDLDLQSVSRYSIVQSSHACWMLKVGGEIEACNDPEILLEVLNVSGAAGRDLI